MTDILAFSTNFHPVEEALEACFGAHFPCINVDRCTEAGLPVHPTEARDGKQLPETLRTTKHTNGGDHNRSMGNGVGLWYF